MADLQAQRLSDQIGPRLDAMARHLAELSMKVAEIEALLNIIDRRTAVQSIPEYLPRG